MQNCFYNYTYCLEGLASVGGLSFGTISDQLLLTHNVTKAAFFIVASLTLAILFHQPGEKWCNFLLDW